MERKWKVLIVVGVGVFMSSLDLFIVNIAFPDIRRDFVGVSLPALSWILSAYAIVFAAGLVPAGRWSDAFGRKRSFLLGLGIFVLASAACAVAPTIGVLIGARVVQAAGAALLMPATLGLLLPEFPPEQRHVAIGAWAAIGGAAAAAGPPLGGLLVAASWRWVFIVNVPIGLAVLAVGARELREIRHPDVVAPDLLGAGLLSAGVGALVVAIVEGPTWGWGSPRVLLLAALAISGLAAVARRSATHPAPIVEPAIVAVRAFRLAAIGSILFYVGFAGMLLGTVLFLTGPWHEPILTAGLMIAPGPATAASFAVPGARLGARFGPGPVGALGGLLFGVGAVWWLTRLGDAPNYAADFLPGMMIGGFGVGLVLPSLTGAAAAALPPARLATGIAVQTTARQIGSALGIAVLVALLGTPAVASDFHPAWQLMLASSLGAALVLAAIGPARRAGLEAGRAPETSPAPARRQHRAAGASDRPIGARARARWSKDQRRVLDSGPTPVRTASPEDDEWRSLRRGRLGLAHAGPDDACNPSSHPTRTLEDLSTRRSPESI
jgi:EmrB/QacA subfamily drug resistance transporter